MTQPLNPETHYELTVGASDGCGTSVKVQARIPNDISDDRRQAISDALYAAQQVVMAALA